MKIIIIGGTGFLGYHATLAALERGHQVASLSIDDIDLTGWYPAEIEVRFGNVFTMSPDDMRRELAGYDALIYSVGPDDRVTPPAPAYDFFYDKLVRKPTALFHAAREAGIQRSVVLNSYFASFDRLRPELKLAEKHPYIKVRVEQAKALIACGNNPDGEQVMDVMVLELPYIFGTMPQRMPIWKDIFIERFFRYPVIFFPGGGTAMITAKHVGEAAVGALEHGTHGERYPIGDENHPFRFMLEQMQIGLGLKKPIWTVGTRIATWSASAIARSNRRKGLESGLNMKHLMRDIMSRDFYIENVYKISSLLNYGRGGVAAAIRETVRACYPDGFK